MYLESYRIPDSVAWNLFIHRVAVESNTWVIFYFFLVNKNVKQRSKIRFKMKIYDFLCVVIASMLHNLIPNRRWSWNIAASMLHFSSIPLLWPPPPPWCQWTSVVPPTWLNAYAQVYIEPQNPLFVKSRCMLAFPHPLIPSHFFAFKTPQHHDKVDDHMPLQVSNIDK